MELHPKRAQELLELAAEGLTDKEIAAALNVQPSTIDWHWRKIRRELGATSRSHAVAIGLTATLEKERANAHAAQSELRADIHSLQKENLELIQLLREINESSEQKTHALAQELSARIRQLQTFSQLERDYETFFANVQSLRLLWYRMEFAPPNRCLQISGCLPQHGIDATAFTSGKVSLVDLIHQDDFASILPSFPLTKENRRPVVHFLYRLRQADSSYRWVFDRTFVPWPEEGDPLEYVGISMDIDDLVRSGCVAIDKGRYWWPNYGNS